MPLSHKSDVAVEDSIMQVRAERTYARSTNVGAAPFEDLRPFECCNN